MSNCSQPSQPIRILIADRSCMASQLLAESLDRDSRFEAVAVAAAAATTDILSAVSARKPDVAVISADFDGGAKKGLQAARAVNAHYRNVHIVVLLELSARESVIAAFRCGAKGVFCRSKPLDEFRACIERVSRGEFGPIASKRSIYLKQRETRHLATASMATRSACFRSGRSRWQKVLLRATAISKLQTNFDSASIP